MPLPRLTKAERRQQRKEKLLYFPESISFANSIQLEINYLLKLVFLIIYCPINFNKENPEWTYSIPKIC